MSVRDGAGLAGCVNMLVGDAVASCSRCDDTDPDPHDTASLPTGEVGAGSGSGLGLAAFAAALSASSLTPTHLVCVTWDGEGEGDVREMLPRPCVPAAAPPPWTASNMVC